MRKPGAARLAGLAAVALLLAACGRDPHLPGDQVDERGVVILEPWDTALYTQSTARVLAQAFPGAEHVPLARFDQAFSDALARHRVVILPHMAILPCEVWKPLEDFLEAGGCAVLWGGRPFAERVWTSPAGLQRERDLVASLVNDAQPAPWSDPQLWWPASDPEPVRRPVREAAPPWPAVEVDIPVPAIWSGLAVSFPPDAAAARNALVFFGRGDARTPHLQVDVREGSGTWWSATCAVGSTWRPVLLSRESLTAPAGAAPGSLSLDRISAIRVGVDGEAPDVPDAPYQFGLSEVRWVRDPRPAWPRVPVLAGLPAPAGAAVMSATHLVSAGGARHPLGGAEVIVQPDPIQRCGEGEGEGEGRLIPLAHAVQGNPERRGVCAQIYADLRPGRPLRRYGWLSLDSPGVGPEAVRRVLRDLVSRLQHGHLILQSGVGAATVREGQELLVRYRHAPELSDAGQVVRVNVEMLDPGGRVLRRVSATPRGPEPQQLDLGRAPEALAGSEDLTVRLRVIEPRSVTILDEVSWPLRVVSARGHVPPRRPIETTGSLLADTGRPVFPLIQAWDEPSAARRVLEATRYPAGHVADWLDRAREIGFNTVAVTVDRSDLLPQYEHLAGELESRRMFALVRLACFPVLHTDWDDARALTRALARCRTDPVLALDLAAPAPLPPESDPAWMAAWERWLVEQFGTLAQAAAGLGGLTEAEAAAVWGRPEDELAPGLRLARRRCRADVLSRHVAAVRDLVRDCGLMHVLTLGPLVGAEADDPAHAAAHLDVLTVAINLRATAAELAGAGFAAAWARGMSAGRPVWWMERGPGTPADAAELAMQDQGARWAALFRLLRRTAAAGGWLAATADGSPPFLRADGSWRPAASQARAFSHQLRSTPLGQAGAWRDRVVEAWTDTGGWNGLQAAWLPRYAEEAARNELVELRPAGFGVETRKLTPRPLLGAGTTVPWQELNAEWVDVSVNGSPVWRAPGTPLTVRRRDKLQLTICNTGSATWTPWTGQQGREHTVQATVCDAGAEREVLRVPRLSMGQRGVVEWTPSEPGLRQLRVILRATGPWGEELTVQVAP